MSEKVVLLTGACGLIGESLVNGLKKENYKLVLIDNNKAKVEELKTKFSEENFLILNADILNKNSLELCINKAHKKFGKIAG